jgi:uncharacterized protein (TIGR02996 family)
MTDERGFIDALLWGRDDATALVYADWLEENGQPERAGLLRAQTEHDKGHSSEAVQRLRESADRCTAVLALSASLRKKLRFHWQRGLLWVTIADGANLSQANLDGLARLPFLTTLGNVLPLPPERLAQLSRWPNLRCIRQSTIPSLSDEQLRAVSELPGVETLVLNGPNVADAQLAHLHAMKRLRSLDLVSSQVTDAGLGRLRPLAGLKVLFLDRCRGVGDAGLAVLGGLVGLEHLALSGTTITDAGLEHLAGLQELRCLDISRTRITGPGLAAVSRLKKLTKLDLSRNEGLDDTHILHLAQLSELRELDIGLTNVSRAHLPRLIEATKLKRIRMFPGQGGRRGRARGVAQAFLDACKERDVFVDTDYE